jgi:hypothetical protein
MNGVWLKDAGRVVASSDLTVVVAAFSCEGSNFSGGSITVSPNGTWYVGVDLFTGAVIALPRLGHRGWIPVLRVVTDDTSIVSSTAIPAEMPKSRIPRTIKKLADGQAISVVIMGSSLTQSGESGYDWPSMIFSPSASLTKYGIPGVTTKYTGVGGAPNQYQLAQTGVCGGNSSMTYDDAGAPVQVTKPGTPPTGRSNMFDGVDLVVIGCLANGGDYRLQCIEPIIRNLRKLGTEVILLSDNPQITSSWTRTYTEMASSGLYSDGPFVKQIADMYGIEYADTAAYVFDAAMRYRANGAVYGLNDSIHMSNGLPAGRTAIPSCGHEVWARAVRSVIPVGGDPAVPETRTYDFGTGEQGWMPYSTANINASSGSLVVTKNTAAVNQWGGSITTLPQIYAGDTVRVRGTASGTSANGVTVGLQYSGWASDNKSVPEGSFDVTITCNTNSTHLLFYGSNNSAALGANFTIDNIVIDITHNAASIKNMYPNRSVEILPIPQSRVVSDFKTPGEAFVILPEFEQFLVAGNAARGTLGAHPWGSRSFARRFYSGTGSTSDMLTVATGKSCGFAAHAVVGLSMIRYSDPVADTGCTVDVYTNNTKIKTLTFGVTPFANEWYSTIFTPSELGATGVGSIKYVTLVVTAGTLKIAALVALTAELEFVPLEDIKFVGSWSFLENDGGTITRGRATDTVNDYAWIKCPDNAQRAQWLIACRSNSQPVDLTCNKAATLGFATNGTNHMRAVGGLRAANSVHAIKLKSAAASPVVGNRSLHVAGAVVILDR